MAESSLDQVTQERPIEIEWKAFELRPAGSPPPDPAYRARVEEHWPRTIAMGRQYGVEMRTHRFGIDTRPAHEGAKFAEAQGTSEQVKAYHDAVFRAYFEEDQDIGDLDVLTAIARQVGLDAEAFRQALDAGSYREVVLAEERFAYRAGISGVPAFIFNDKYLLVGVHPPEQLKSVIEQIERQGNESLTSEEGG
ncbi:MAG TPA: hypothetical protein DEP84_33405 [Chloroflexi bacterium]|nr:hypothetical protein [Chloroflexota bacterium]